VAGTRKLTPLETERSVKKTVVKPDEIFRATKNVANIFKLMEHLAIKILVVEKGKGTWPEPES